jgi:hypothetical protein
MAVVPVVCMPVGGKHTHGQHAGQQKACYLFDYTQHSQVPLIGFCGHKDR